MVFVSNTIHLLAEVSRQSAGALAADPEGDWLCRRLPGLLWILYFVLTKFCFIYMKWKEITTNVIKRN